MASRQHKPGEAAPGAEAAESFAVGAGDGDVWVVVEQRDGVAAEVGLELLGRARELADRLGVQVGAVLIGAGGAVKALAPALIARGADLVYAVAHDDLAGYLAQPYTEVVTTLIGEHRPQIVLYGATTTGRDLAPRVASALRTGLTADCTDLRIGDHTQKGEEYKNLLYQIRPAFGGNIVATIISPLHRPQMATVREGVMVMPEEDQNRSGRIVSVPVTRAQERVAARDGIVLSDADFAVRVIRRVLEEKRVDLKGARIIVAGGVGVGSREGFALVEELARTLGGVVGASRAAVDAGWVDHAHQIGQTGTTVRPKLYIACGISGSVQHRAGMDQSARILAINSDPQAPIFSVAHYGVVGDLHKVIPLLIHAYRRKGAAATDGDAP